MDFDYFLKLQKAYFHTLGFDIFSKKKPFRRPQVAMLSMVPLVTFMMPMSAFVANNISDVDKATDTLASVLVAFLAIVKFFLILYLYRDFVELIFRVQEIATNEWRENQIYADIIENENRRDQFFSNLYSVCFIVACISANLMPIIGMLASYFLKGYAEPLLPFPSDYPWDIRKPLNFMFTYLWNTVAGSGVVLASVSIDTLFCSFSHNICGLFKIAQRKLLHLKADQLDALKNTIYLHQQIVEICSELNVCYQPLICAQFFISSLQLCALGFQVSAKFTQPEIIYYASFVCSMLVQIFIYSYCGENIKTESYNFAIAVYESSWYEMSPHMCRMLQTSMIRAQRTCNINGYFFEANMEAFASIVKTAMSYVTLLRSFSS